MDSVFYVISFDIIFIDYENRRHCFMRDYNDYFRKYHETWGGGDSSNFLNYDAYWNQYYAN